MVGLLIAAVQVTSTFAQPAAVDYHAMMRATIDSWVASQSDKGFLPYGFNFLTGQAIEPNGLSRAQLIRQVGAAYILAKYYERFRDARLEEPIRRALTAYAALSLPIGKGPVQQVLERTRLLSVPVGRWKLQTALSELGWLYTSSGNGKVLSHDGTYRSVVPGALTLALLTELTYSHVTGDDRFAAWRSAWLEGLLALHVPGAGFRASPESITDDDHYVNAQGWLALAVYSDLAKADEHVTKALREVENALMSRYSEQPTGDFYHWGAMAAAQRFKSTGEARYLDFLQQQAAYFFERLEPRINISTNTCATMEGLAATYSALVARGKGSTALAARIARWLIAERDKLPGLQIKSGQKGMQLGGDGYLQSARMADFSGGFLWGLYDPTTRIDAGAHCVSAMLMMDANGLLSAK